MSGIQRYSEGAPTLDETRQFQETADMSQLAGPLIPNMTLPDVKIDGGKTPSLAEIKEAYMAVNKGKFPIRPLPHDPYDKIWDTKQGLVQSRVVDASRPLPFTDEDLLYLQQKAAAEEYAAYQTWGANRYKIDDPATRDWYSKVCPSYFEQREQLIDDQIDTMANYAKIRLRGPRSEDDLKLEYLIETGRVDLPTGPVWDPFTSVMNEAGIKEGDSAETFKAKMESYNQRVYQKGIFSPLRAITPVDKVNSSTSKMAWAGNKYDKADVRGDRTKPFTGAGVGILPPQHANIGKNYSGPDLGMYNRAVTFADDRSEYSIGTTRGWENMREGVTYKISARNQAGPNVPEPVQQQSMLSRMWNAIPAGGMFGSAV